MAPTKSSKPKEQKEGTEGDEDHCLRTHGLEHRIITLTVVAQNGLGIRSSHFDALLKEMTEHQVQVARALKDHEHVAKKEHDNVEQGRKEAVSKLIS